MGWTYRHRTSAARAAGVRRGVRAGAVVLALGLCAAAAPAAHAADPQPYEVKIADTGNAKLDGALADASRLEQLRKTAPVGPFPLIGRAREDVGRLVTVLQSFGYYKGRIDITIDGEELTDPALPGHLARSKGTAKVKVGVSKGPQFKLGKVEIDGTVPPDARAKLKIAPGDPAIASDVLDAGNRLLTALQEDGYALAKVPPPVAIERAKADALDITYNVTTGPKLDIGPIAITGLETLNESFIRKRLTVHAGELYQPSKIDAARRDLAKLDVVRAVTVTAADKPGPDGRLPITFKVQERPEHAVGVTGAYSTDLGGSLKLTWTHRNVFGNAERWALSGAMTGLGGTATNAIGYDLTSKLTEPDFLRRDQSLQFDLEAVQQDLDAYSQRAYTTALAINRTLSDIWKASVGIAGEHERIVQEGTTRTYRLVGFPGTLSLDTTGISGPLGEPTQGWRAALSGVPTVPLGAGTGVFAILQASASRYIDIGKLWSAKKGQSVIAMRALLGSIVGATQLDVPPDRRFYGGGSATVRGYAYQSIGPRFPDDKPVGGTSIDAVTIELRQRVFGDFGAVAFVDAGQVSASNVPFDGTPRVGVGVGVRYYTPIGPVRLDVAVPLDKPPGGDSFEIYIGLGQAF